MSATRPPEDSSGTTEEPQDGADAWANGTAKSAHKRKARGKTRVSANELQGPSPSAATNLAIADIALRGGSALARQAIERALLGRQYAPSKARKILKGRTMRESLLHTALARIAFRSMPGAIVVGGALLAKTLYDRGKARQEPRQDDDTLEDIARKGDGS